MSAQSLRPQAERALRRTAARGVKRDVGVQQERHVVTGHVEIALVNVGDVRKRIQILNLRRIRIVHDLAVLQEGNAGNVFQRLAFGVVDHGVIKLFAGHEIDRRTIAQRLLRQHAHVRSNESNLDLGIASLDGARQANVARKAGGRGEQNEKLVVLGNLNGLLRRNIVRRRIQQAALPPASQPDKPATPDTSMTRSRGWRANGSRRRRRSSQKKADSGTGF